MSQSEIGNLSTVAAAAHQVHAVLTKLRDRVAQGFTMLCERRLREVRMEFTEPELTALHGSLDASVKRLEVTFRVGEATVAATTPHLSDEQIDQLCRWQVWPDGHKAAIAAQAKLYNATQAELAASKAEVARLRRRYEDQCNWYKEALSEAGQRATALAAELARFEAAGRELPSEPECLPSMREIAHPGGNLATMFRYLDALHAIATRALAAEKANEVDAERLKFADAAVWAMAEDGWLSYGVEGMTEPQQLVCDYTLKYPAMAARSGDRGRG